MPGQNQKSQIGLLESVSLVATNYVAFGRMSLGRPVSRCCSVRWESIGITTGSQKWSLEEPNLALMKSSKLADRTEAGVSDIQRYPYCSQKPPSICHWSNRISPNHTYKITANLLCSINNAVRSKSKDTAIYQKKVKPYEKGRRVGTTMSCGSRIDYP